MILKISEIQIGQQSRNYPCRSYKSHPQELRIMVKPPYLTGDKYVRIFIQPVIRAAILFLSSWYIRTVKSPFSEVLVSYPTCFDPKKVGKAIAHILGNRGMGEVKFIGSAEKAVEEIA